MSELRVDSVKSKGGGAPDLPKGVTISGIATAATLGATTVDVSNVNVSGVVTSGTLSGSLLSTGTPTLGLGVTINSSGLVVSGVATAGIVSATTLYGDGSNLSGVGATIAPLFYNPDISDSLVLVGTGIGITFNSQIKAGTGNITIRETNASGTVVENFGVGSSVTISENRVSFTPTAGLTTGTVYYLNYPSGCFTNNEGTDYVGTAYTFVVKPIYYQLWAVGGNAYGMLGQNNVTLYSSPVQIPGTTWSSIARSSDNTASQITFKSDNTMWFLGRAQYGESGLNDVVSRSSPTQIPGTWASATSGSNFTYGVTTTGTLWAWGRNNEGQLGQNNKTDYSSPVQVPGTTWASGVDKTAAGDTMVLAIKTDGTLWGWGENDETTLGQNQSTPAFPGVSSPIQITSATNWNKCSNGWMRAGAINTSGELFIWGASNAGQGGNNVNYWTGARGLSSPTQLPGTTWKTVSLQETTSFAVKTDGTMWAWGNNQGGQLGQNSVVWYSSPVQIPGTTWDDVDIGGYGPATVAALKTDGTLWAWGQNNEGSSGQNNRTYYSSPVQVGSGTDWDSIAQGDYSTYYISKT